MLVTQRYSTQRFNLTHIFSGTEYRRSLDRNIASASGRKPSVPLRRLLPSANNALPESVPDLSQAGTRTYSIPCRSFPLLRVVTDPCFREAPGATDRPACAIRAHPRTLSEKPLTSRKSQIDKGFCSE